jgi:rare lipoprotein A
MSLPIFAYAQNAEYGKASYYADKFHGRTTASGEYYFSDSLTAAHPTLPFGSVVKVTNIKNERSIVVRINDRGPFINGRIIDLSKKAMQMLKGLEAGLIEVKVEPITGK